MFKDIYYRVRDHFVVSALHNESSEQPQAPLTDEDLLDEARKQVAETPAADIPALRERTRANISSKEAKWAKDHVGPIPADSVRGVYVRKDKMLLKAIEEKYPD